MEDTLNTEEVNTSTELNTAPAVDDQNNSETSGEKKPFGTDDLMSLGQYNREVSNNYQKKYLKENQQD